MLRQSSGIYADDKAKSTHPAHYIANEMAFAHNAMLRGLNAIYLQAPNVPSNSVDASDFLFFVVAWSDWILHHHILEETQMFPGFEAVEGMKAGHLQDNVDQHHAFSEGLTALSEYAKSTSAGDYDGPKVVELINAFGDTLREHLADEIGTLWAMEAVPSPRSAELLAVYKRCEAEASKQDMFTVPPMVMGLCDTTFQGGNDWPKLPWGAGFIVNWVFAGRHKGAWRFLPCDMYRTPRELQFLDERKEERVKE